MELIFTSQDKETPLVVVEVVPKGDDSFFKVTPAKLEELTGGDPIHVGKPFVITLNTPDTKTAYLNEVLIVTDAAKVKVTVNGETKTVSAPSS